MIWNIDLDDFKGLHCDSGKYPLTTAINRATMGTVPTESATTGTTRPTVTTSTPTTLPYTGPPTTAIPTTHDPANFCAGKTDGHHPVPDDCTSFYNCGGGTGGKTTCQTNLIYDTVLKTCVYPFQLSPDRKNECHV